MILFKDNDKYVFIFLSLTALILTALMYIPLWNASFWVIDDHEIIIIHQNFIESNTNFFKYIYDSLLATEIGSFPNHSRFRPVYYLIRIVKSLLFVNNSTYWFVFQTTIFFISILAFGFTIKRFFKTPIAIAAMVVLASLPFNLDMWSRLGPAENGAFFFCMIFLLSLSQLSKNTWAWPLSCLAAAAAMGYKENFILLLVPLFAGYYYQKYLSKQKTSLLWIIPPCFMSILLATVLVKVVTGQIGHIYAIKTSTSSSIGLGLAYFTTYHFIFCFISILPIILTKLFFDKKLYNFVIKKNLYLYGLIFFTVIIMSCSNYIFYQGNIHISSRYAFPYLFLLMIPPLITAHFLISLIVDNKIFNRIIIFCMIILVIPTAYAQTKIFKHSLNHAALTKNFKKALDRGKQFERTVLFNTGQPINLYEPYFSFKLYALAHFTSSEIDYYPLFFPKPNSELNKQLETTLKAEAAHKQISLVENKVLLLTLKDQIWKDINFVSNERKIADIPQEIENFKYKNIDFVRNNLFLFTSKMNVAALQLIGEIPQDTQYFINGVRIPQEQVNLTSEGILLNLQYKNTIRNPLSLYIITLEFTEHNKSLYSLDMIILRE